jgi:hypothetical protein
LSPLLTEEHHLSLPGHWDQDRAGEISTTCLYQIQRYIFPNIIIPINEQQPTSQHNIFFQKRDKKGPIFPKKKWKIGQRSIPDNLIFCVSQSIGGFHETSQIFAHAEIITSNEQKREHTG